MSAKALLDLVEYVARLLVLGPEAPPPDPEKRSPVEVRGIPGEGAALTIELRVSEEDRGKIIGKQGRTIEAIRVLLGAAAARQEERVSLRLAEE